MYCLALAQKTKNLMLSFLPHRGQKLIELPYTVKGMDVSFSGILSHIEVRSDLGLSYGRKPSGLA